jgi:hypothetical protein
MNGPWRPDVLTVIPGNVSTAGVATSPVPVAWITVIVRKSPWRPSNIDTCSSANLFEYLLQRLSRLGKVYNMCAERPKSRVQLRRESEKIGRRLSYAPKAKL